MTTHALSILPGAFALDREVVVRTTYVATHAGVEYECTSRYRLGAFIVPKDPTNYKLRRNRSGRYRPLHASSSAMDAQNHINAAAFRSIASQHVVIVKCERLKS